MTPTVEASFFWIMVAVAFVFGALCQQWTSRIEVSILRRTIGEALSLIADLSALARVGGRPLPVAMRKRMIDLRDRWGE